jgi:ElaB/YqjD/DUF883 family membrane-anchored ribosome-binding protein
MTTQNEGGKTRGRGRQQASTPEPATDPFADPAAEATLAAILVELRALRMEVDTLRAAALPEDPPEEGDQHASVREKLRDAAEAFSERSHRKVESVEADLRENMLRAADFVARQPGTAMGMAAGLGFLIGLMTRR